MEELKDVIVENGMEYHLAEDGCYYPVISLEQETDFSIGKYGLMRCEYIKSHCHGYYMELLPSGKLNEHLREVEEEYYSMLEQIADEMKRRDGVNEALKAQNQMLWVAMVNGIMMAAEEKVLKELIYVW